MLNKKIIVSALLPCAGSLGFVGYKPAKVPYKIMVNYNGQADLLLSLQIPPDYYPYQFKKTSLYDYLTNVDEYLVTNEHTSSEKQKLKGELQKRITQLLKQVKEFGPSLWNEDLYDSGLVFKNDQQWSNRQTSILFLEQFIADDFPNLEESATGLPTYKDLIITNYRAARDPYTIFSKNIFNCFKEESIQKSSSSAEDEKCKAEGQDKKLVAEFKKYVENYEEEEVNSLYRFGKYIGFWNNLFAKTKHRLTDLEIANWIKENSLFSLDPQEDKKLIEKYERTIFTHKELELLKRWINSEVQNQNEWKSAYIQKVAGRPGISLVHHPALEQTTLPGSAPLAEGSQKEVIVFLFQFAALIDEYVNRDGGNFKSEFQNDSRKSFMESALTNAKVMAKNLQERIKAIREYFQKIGVVDPKFNPESLKGQQHSSSNSESKSFAIVTYPPSSFGAGEATIQSMSKFPFLYTDIGLKQVMPKNLKDDLFHTHGDQIHLDNEIFSVDDNGWWWKVGNVNLDSSNLFEFENQADSLLVLANPEDWNLINGKDSATLKSLSALLKQKPEIDPSKLNKESYPISYNKYHLWNEGLRSPIALNLLLDNLVDIFQKQYDPEFNKSKSTSGASNGNNCYQKAMDWGNYWYESFVKGLPCKGGVATKQATANCEVAKA